MKKVLKLNAIIVILFSVILMFFNYKNSDSLYWMNWGKSKHSQNIYLRNTGYSGSDLYTMLTGLAEASNVNLIKTDYLVINDEETIIKSIYIGDEKDDLFLNSSLKSGQWIKRSDNHENQYISTRETEDTLCKGQLFDFLGDDKVEIWTLTRFMSERGSLDGDYIVSSDNPNSIVKFINEFSKQSGISVESLVQQKTFVVIEKSPIETISIIGIMISLAIFGLLGVFYAIQSSKKIGIMKLNGHSNLSIWENLISSTFFTIIIFTLILDIGIVFLVKNNTVNFMFHIFKIELLILILLLVTSIFIYWIIKRNKISNLIKNMKSVKHIVSLTHVIKSIVFFILVAFSLIIGSGLEEANDELDKMKSWESVSDLGVLMNLEVGEDAASIRQGDSTLANDFANYYQFLEQGGALYTNVMTFDPHVQFRTKYDEMTNRYSYVDYFDQQIVPQNYTVTTFQINENYLKRFPLYDVNGNKIEISNRKERLILIPESKQDEQKQLEEIYKSSYIDSIKSSERKQGIENNMIPDVQIKSIIYKEASDGYFTFSTAFEKTNYVVHSPIFEVLNNDNMAFFEKSNIYVQGLNFPLKIDFKGLSSKQYNQDILQTLEKYHLDDNKLKYMSIGEVFSTQINTLKNACKQFTIALIIVFLVMIVITMHLTRLLIEANKQRYCVEKLYGYSFIERYKGVLALELFLNAIIIGIASVFTTQGMQINMTALSLGIICILFIVNIVIIIMFIKFFEDKSVSQIVKGQ